MPHEPKKRHSRARQGKRRASIHLAIPRAVLCQNCGAQNLSHTVCSTCGFYKGAQVVPGKTAKSDATTA